jgi:hypothetical protein
MARLCGEGICRGSRAGHLCAGLAADDTLTRRAFAEWRASARAAPATRSIRAIALVQAPGVAQAANCNLSGGDGC